MGSGRREYRDRVSGGGEGGVEAWRSVFALEVCREGGDAASVDGVARARRFARSMLARRSVAAVTRVGVGRDMTPRVRWRVVRGRMADGWKRGVVGLVSDWAGAAGESFVLELKLASVFVCVGLTAEVVMSEVKCSIEACSLGLEASVTSGMQRKWVSGGLGGMAGEGCCESERSATAWTYTRPSRVRCRDQKEVDKREDVSAPA